MGLFDILRPGDVRATRSALDEANAPDGTDDAITVVIKRILSVGIDGVRGYPGAVRVAEKALAASGGNVERAIGSVINQHYRGAGTTGFLTSLGGFFTMAVAVPVNVFAFYVQATRMTAAIAHLRGYDIADPTIRTAVLLAEVGSNASDILRNVGVGPSLGTTAALTVAGPALPRSAIMVIQKAVGFQLLRSVGRRAFVGAGRFVPVAGGAFGAGIDLAMMKRIADQARIEFPPAH
ncbi:MAG: hypothetical protein QM708_11670 [Propioniciclava sp.]|uniref:hypothetical protein n=1 Tax=Propioniciclava sp. TaxID=2038686 RepID=UPI0039E709E5